MPGAGESFDLEREEILGDSFLKYWTSARLYLCEGEALDEGALTTKGSFTCDVPIISPPTNSLNLPY